MTNTEVNNFQSKPVELTPTKVHSLIMRLDLSEGIQKSIASGSYEPEQTGWMVECLAPGDRFVDIGANFGWYIALVSTLHNRSIDVFAFEPSPVAAQVIATTIDENHLKNVTLVRSAVGACDGEISLYMPMNDSLHSPSVFFSNPNFVPLQVPLISLDSYALLADGRPINLIKIDVEGSEPNVIRGMSELCRRGMVKNIICEFNSGWLRRNSWTPAKLFELITSLGFAVHKKTTLWASNEPDGKRYECQDIWFKLAK